MGILDDAIREHLELKRKHGVPEEELQRQEEEALGPARREVAQQLEEAEPAGAHTATAEPDEPEAPAEGDGSTTAAADDTELFDMEADEGRAAEVAASKPIEIEEPEPSPEPVSGAALGDTEPHGFEVVEDEEALEAELGDEAAPDDEQEPGDEPEPGEDREPDDEELLSAEEEAAAEEGDPDVLEDTPDFLQETPEHDRLWFEQKPPRDFDFD
jgi:hypothetical protein